DKQLHRRVALKLLPLDYTRNKDRLRRFQQEAQSASGLNHPNILTIHELGEIEAQQFIATEFVDGQTLRERMKSGPLPMVEALEITIQVAVALGAAHMAGIVHRDIKPENIMLRPDGYVKVLDFGLAKLTEQPSGTTNETLDTAPGLVLGTVKYMSPEQARGLDVDARSDIFSLTVVFYEMLTGQAPFEGDTVSDLIATILKDDPPSLVGYLADYPESLQPIITKGLRKDRKQRYLSVSGFLDDLRNLKQAVETQSKLNSPEFHLFSDSRRFDTGRQRAVSSLTTATWTKRFTSSAEFLVSEAKHHKSLTGVVMATLFMFTLSVGYLSYRFIAGRTRPQQNMSLVRLTLGGFIGNAAISPDARYLAYVSEAGGLQSLWIRQIATNSNAQIIPPRKLDYGDISFSPDGNYLFYFGSTKEGEGPGLCKVPVIGGEPKRVIDGISNSNGEGPVTFSPDYKRLAFTRGYPSGETALFVANVDGTDERKLANREGFDSLAVSAWSPDGKLIACSEVLNQNGKTHWRLVAVRTEDGVETPIKTKEFRSIGEIAWLADGSGLLMIAANEDEGTQVWQVDYPAGTARKVFNDIGSYSGLSLTADSSVLITKRNEVITNIWNQSAEDLRQTAQITSGTGRRDGWMGIGWTPDERIVYSSHASGQPDIWIMNADGSNPQQLTNNMGCVYNGLAVSPDGKYVVFVSRRAGNTNLWRIDIDGRNPVQLTHGLGEFNPIFFPDGQWVSYGSGGKAWKVSINGGEPIQYGDGFPYTLGVSPDGKLKAYVLNNGETNPKRMAVAPSGGGAPITVLELPSGAQISGRMRWTPDSRALTYIVAQNGVLNIWVQPIDGGPAQPVTDFKADLIQCFAWSPDGKQLAVARGTTPTDLILVRNFR
ncbi:MAG TPA: protein kinase, partial [Pyrinomonadaceae bacterium]|nr:protein kinase [Pyrinomonadaceae bacterium]